MNRYARALLLLCFIGLAGTVRADWFGLPFGGSKDVSASVSGAPAKKRAAVSVGSEVKSARVLWLDKQTNRKQVVVLQSGTPQNLNGLTVALNKCLADYDNVLLQDVAWLEVTENAKSMTWFAGWMFNTYPEVATLEHPRYDIQLVGCGDTARAKPAAKIVEPTGTTVAPADTHDSEAPPAADSEAPAAESDPAADPTDPYYVPGVGGPGEAPAAPAEPALPTAPATAEPEASQSEAAPAAPVEAAPALQPMEEENRADDTQELRRMMETGGTY